MCSSRFHPIPAETYLSQSGCAYGTFTSVLYCALEPAAMPRPAEIRYDTRAGGGAERLPRGWIREPLQRSGKRVGIGGVVEQTFAAIADDMRKTLDARCHNGKAGRHVLEDFQW